MTPFLTKNLKFRQKYSSLTPFLSQFVLFLTSHNTTSQNVGGTNAWAVPHLKFWGDRPIQFPLGLRPCPYFRKIFRVYKNFKICNVIFPLFRKILYSHHFLHFPLFSFNLCVLT